MDRDITGLTPDEAKTELRVRDAEKMNRRSLLAKFGLKFGAAAVFALSVDDLARTVAREMKRHAGDNEIANAVANEFQSAGAAYAFKQILNCPRFTDCEACCKDVQDACNISGADYIECTTARLNCRRGCVKKAPVV